MLPDAACNSVSVTSDTSSIPAKHNCVCLYTQTDMLHNDKSKQTVTDLTVS